MKQTNTDTKSTDNLLALLDDNSLIQLAEQYITHGNGKVLPEGAPYFIRLAELGYIRYLRWAAECYNHGFGCERNEGLAAKYYFESLLFEGNELSKRALKTLRPEWAYYGGDNLVKRLIKTLLCGAKSDVEDALVKISELIMAGEIREYARDAAYIPLKRIYEAWSWDCPLKNYRLGECLLYGIGCEINPFAAVPVLMDAIDDLEYDVEDIERGDTDWIEDTFHTASDYISALEEARNMLAQAEREAERLFDPFEGYFHGHDIFEGDLDDYEDYRLEQFEQEKPPARIKRTGTS
jgi:hypothetical protein